MVYVTLLRGINVGGNTRIEMPKLKELFESSGCKNVSTYINSGNVIFEDSRPREELEEIIETGIEKNFGLKVPVVIRSADNIKKLCTEIPADWTNDKEQKTDVLFLWGEIDDEDILSKVKINPDIENVLYIDGALVWNIGRENVTRGGGIMLIKSEYYKHMTARNINTVRKLNSLIA